MSEAPSPFLPGTTLQFAFDATSLGLFLECRRKYYLTIIQGWRKRDSSVHLWFGGHFASALERYHKERALGADHETSLDAIVQRLLCDTWEGPSPEFPDGRPVDFEHAAKNRHNLLRSVIWYLEEYANDASQTVILANGKPAVELSFRFDLPHLAPNGQPYMYSGHLDRVVNFGGAVYIQDQKTSGSAITPYFFRQFSPDLQMTGYTLASKVVFETPVQGVMIDGAQIAVGFTAFGRGITTRTNAQLDEFVAELRDHFDDLERAAETQHYPHNPKACGNYGGCVFREVCSSDPSVRENYLQTGFEKRYWNPLEER